MLNLICRTKEEVSDEQHYSVLTLSGMREEWDAEKNGVEPGYDEFVSLLGRIISILLEENTVFSSYVERGNKQIKTINLLLNTFALFHDYYPFCAVERQWTD